MPLNAVSVSSLEPKYSLSIDGIELNNEQISASSWPVRNFTEEKRKRRNDTLKSTMKKPGDFKQSIIF